MRTSRTVLSVVSLLAVAGVSQAADLGIANNYNLFALGNFTSQFSDTEGLMAVGGNVQLNGYDIGLKRPGQTVLDAGGNVNFSNGMARGVIRHGGTFTSSSMGFSNGGSAIPGSAIDFLAAGNELRTASTFWGGLAPTGTATKPFSTILFQGSDPVRNVFTVTSSFLNTASDINILVPEGSTALINVLGTSVNLKNYGYNYNGSQDNNKFRKVVWNLPDATSVNFEGSIRGSVFAPRADATTAFGAIEGTLVVNNFTGSLQINDWTFNGDLQPVPEPATMAALGLGVLAALRRRKKA